MLLAQAGMMGVFLANGCFVVLFLLGTGIDTDVFSLLAMGRRKKDTLLLLNSSSTLSLVRC